jgi:hypothetical protein
LIEPIPDNILNRFRLLAARETLSRASTEEIVTLADQTMKEGIYHDALMAIGDALPQTPAAIRPQLQFFCDDFLIPIGDRAWALQYLLDHFIRQMALQNSEPNGELVFLMHAVGPETLDRIYIDQQALGLDRILFLHMQYNYLSQVHDIPKDELDAAQASCIRLIPELRAAASEWLKRYGSIRSAPETSQ